MLTGNCFPVKKEGPRNLAFQEGKSWLVKTFLKTFTKKIEFVCKMFLKVILILVIV